MSKSTTHRVRKRSTGSNKDARRKAAAVAMVTWRAIRVARKLERVKRGSRRTHKRRGRECRKGGAGALSVGSIAVGSFALGASAFGALAVGAVAIRRLAIKRAAIGKLDVRKVRVGRLEVDELVVHSDIRPSGTRPAEGS
jgi:hypothetical protein